MLNTTISVAIFGDSFSSDWRKKSESHYGWPNMLAETFAVTNFSQPGISEYKILQQIKQHDLEKFNIIIIAHTSPSRVHTKKHPIHDKNSFYKNCDLLIADIMYHASKLKNIFNFPLHAAKNWFLYHYDEMYQEEIYNLIRKEIDLIFKDKLVIEVKNFDVSENKNHTVLDYRKFVKFDKNFSNHYDENTNKKIYNDIKKIIEKMQCHTT